MRFYHVVKNHLCSSKCIYGCRRVHSIKVVTKRAGHIFSIKQKLILATFQLTEFSLNHIPSPIPIIFVLTRLVSLL